MNFQKLVTVESADEYLDQAFRQAGVNAERARETRAQQTRFGKLMKSKDVEREKVLAVQKVLRSNLQRILKSFPSLDQLPKFYLELIKITLDYGKFKKAFGGVQWAQQRIDAITQKQLQRIKRAAAASAVNLMRREYYGRTASIMKQINDNLQYLKEARRVMKKYPDIKEDISTVAICGLPNVGKSTLLKALTSAQPEIKEYPFTTKTVNAGILKTLTKTYQVVDTPGTLDRPLEKTNAIEKQAYLVVKYLADLVLFVFDPTETCGFSIQEQLNVFERILHSEVIQERKLPMVIVINKIDLDRERKEELREALKKRIKEIENIPVFEISAESGAQIERLREEVLKLKRKAIPEKQEETMIKKTINHSNFV